MTAADAVRVYRNWRYPPGWHLLEQGRRALVIGKAPMGSSRAEASDELRVVSAMLSIDGSADVPVSHAIKVQPYEQIRNYSEAGFKQTITLTRTFPDPRHQKRWRVLSLGIHQRLEKRGCALGLISGR